MAKDLVRTRRYIQKFYAMRTQLQAVSLRIQTLRSNQQMGEAMKGATKAMGMMNRQMNLPQVSHSRRARSACADTDCVLSLWSYPPSDPEDHDGL